MMWSATQKQSETPISVLRSAFLCLTLESRAVATCSVITSHDERSGAVGLSLEAAAAAVLPLMVEGRDVWRQKKE